MNMVEPLPERRKYKRIKVANSAIAASGDWVGRITDVSLGGIAIVHHGSEPWPPDIDEIDLQVDRHRFRLPVTVVREEVMPGERPVPIRRCGVQFRELEPRQLYKLEYFIWSQTSGWPQIPFPHDDMK
jgi:c-di-GMP-binding flagellar brake protein YcgR